MKHVELTRGLCAIVDNEDFEWISEWKWCALVRDSGVPAAVRRDGAKFLYMHREIVGLFSGDKRVCDHINHDTLDNRRENLRIATSQQNAWNSRKRELATSSAYKGVSWDAERANWTAHITAGGKHVRLGRFLTETDAAAAYDAAARIHYGEFACTNQEAQCER